MDDAFAMKFKPDVEKSLKKMDGNRDVYCVPGKDINFKEDCEKVTVYHRKSKK